MELYAVIMAGGGGTRFWPMSRRKTPKQLLNLSGNDYMINETIDRMAMVIPKEHIYIVTNEQQADLMLDVTAGRLSKEHILTEPAARNTAACIGYASAHILKTRGDGILCVVPSDAYIRDWEVFSHTLEKAIKTAEKTDRLVTIGISPTFPATGYGYIQKGAALDSGAFMVQTFREKPDAETALHYLQDGSYLWNSGMFIWRATTILHWFEKLLPDLYADLQRIAAAIGTPEEQSTIQAVYPQLRKISVDYGIMEHCNQVAVVPGSFGWSDVGSWDMLRSLHQEDSCGNVFLGDVCSVDSQNCIASSSGRLLSLIGMENTIVVETADSVLVCRSDRAQDVKKIVDILAEKGRTDLL